MSSPIEGVPLAPAQVEFVTTHKQEASAIAQQVAGLPDSPDLLTKALSFVQSKIKGIEDTRLSITEPLTRAKANVDTHFRSLRLPFEEAKDLLKKRLETLELARRALVAQVNQPQALPAPGPDPVFSLPTGNVGAPVPSAVGTFRDEWDWQLEDINLVPREYLAVNAATLKLYTKQHKNSQTIPPIPGLKFTRVPKAVAR
jgi:hypothetical protein